MNKDSSASEVKNQLGLRNQPALIIPTDDEDQTSNPGIPYKGKMLILPKNLIRETQYSLGILRISNITSGLSVIAKTLNNITEILSFQTIFQNPTLHEQTQTDLKEINIILEKHKGDLITQLEQNRINIKKDQDLIRELGEKKYETLIKNQERIINQINEQQDSKRIDRELKEIKESITKLQISFESNFGKFEE